MVMEKLEDDFGYTLSIDDFPPSLSLPTHTGMVPPEPVVPVATQHLGDSASDGAVDGEKVGKSAKTIKVEFAFGDSAIQHLQKEQSLLNEIDLLYPSVNVKTKVSIVVSHCDDQVKGIAMTVKEGFGQYDVG